MQHNTEEQLTLFAGDSLASHTVDQERCSAQTMTEISGRKCSELSKSAGPVGLLVKTLLTSSIWYSDKSRLTWKQLATKSGSHCAFRLALSTPTIDANGHGFVPTPTTSDYKGSVRKRYRGSPDYRSNLPEYFRLSEADPAYPNPETYEAIMGYPPGHTELSD